MKSILPTLLFALVSLGLTACDTNVQITPNIASNDATSFGGSATVAQSGTPAATAATSSLPTTVGTASVDSSAINAEAARVQSELNAMNGTAPVTGSGSSPVVATTQSVTPQPQTTTTVVATRNGARTLAQSPAAAAAMQREAVGVAR